MEEPPSIKDQSHDNTDGIRRRKSKKITRTDVIYKELIVDPLKGPQPQSSKPHHRYALCEYAIVMPLLLTIIGGLISLLGLLGELALTGQTTGALHIMLFEGWLSLMIIMSLTLALKTCQIGGKVFCCHRIKPIGSPL